MHLQCLEVGLNSAKKANETQKMRRSYDNEALSGKSTCGLSTGRIKHNRRLLTSDQREQKAHFLLSTATYGHKQVAAGSWHLSLPMLGE